MRKRAMLLAVLLVTLPVAVQAQYNYRFFYASNTSCDTNFGAVAGAKRGYDGETRAVTYQKDINNAIYKESGQDGWDGVTGLYQMDRRPFLNEGETVVERIYLWAGTLAPVSDLQLYRVYPPVLSDGMSYTLRLVQIPTGITYNGPTEWGADHGTISLPFYATDNPLTGYEFEATITAPVPEPSSLVGLACGAAGLGAFALRRRRR